MNFVDNYNFWKFLTTTTPPRYGHQQNLLESTGNVFLTPFASAVGAFEMKDPDLISRITALAIILFTLPLTVIGMIIKGIGYVVPHSQKIADDQNIEHTSDIKHSQLYELVQEISAIFIENKLTREQDGETQPKFVAVSGSALGAVRHKGRIPWDDDDDLALFKEDEEAFLALGEKFKEKGIEIIRSFRADSMYKLRFTNEEIEKRWEGAKESDTGIVDLFIFDQMSDGCYTFDRKLSRCRWPNEFFTREEVSAGFSMVSYGDPAKNLRVPILKDPKPYLSRYYGPNWERFGVQTHGHVSVCGVPLAFYKLGSHYFEIKSTANQPGKWV